MNSSSAIAGWGLAPKPAGDEHAEAGLEGAVGQRPVDGDDADVVEHRLTAVGHASGEVDLELPGQPLGVRAAQEVLEGGIGPRRDVEDLVRAGAGQVAAGDVADGVAARLPAREAHVGEAAERRGDVLQLDEVELDVLPGGEVPPAPAPPLGDVGQGIELIGIDGAVRRLDAQHLVVPTLTLPVDPVVQPADAEDVLLEIAGEVGLDVVLELGDVTLGGRLRMPLMVLP